MFLQIFVCFCKFLFVFQWNFNVFSEKTQKFYVFSENLRFFEFSVVQQGTLDGDYHGYLHGAPWRPHGGLHGGPHEVEAFWGSLHGTPHGALWGCLGISSCNYGNFQGNPMVHYGTQGPPPLGSLKSWEKLFLRKKLACCFRIFWENCKVFLPPMLNLIKNPYNRFFSKFC